MSNNIDFIDFESLSNELKYMFLLSLKVYVYAKDNEMSKDEYIKWCESVWLSGEFSNLDKLRTTLDEMAHTESMKVSERRGWK